MLSQTQKILKDNWLLLLLLITYLVVLTRNLTIIPIFGDEAIYLSWSQTIREDFAQLFIPLSDGKQPLFMWLTALIVPLFKDQLLAPRTVVLVAGLLGAIGMYGIGNTLANKKMAIAAAVLYALTPIIFFYNRMGVPDGLLTVWGIWVFYFGLRLVRQPNLFWSCALGLSLGFGLLTKSPAIFFAILLPSLLLARSFNRQTWLKDIVRIGLLFALSAGIAGIMYATLRISPLYSVIGQRQPDFVFGPSHLLENPLDPFVSRIPEVFSWLTGYLTMPIFVFGIIGFIVGVLRKQWYITVLFLWFLVPLLLEMALAKGFTPRYFVFTIPFFVLLSVSGFYWLTSFLHRKLPYSWLILVLVLVIPARFIWFLVTDPPRAPIPQKERTGYLEDWTAGHGIKEVSQYVKALPQELQILVGTEGHFGTLPDGLIAYARKTPNIHVEGMGQSVGIRYIPPTLFDWLSKDKNNRSFLVVNKSRMETTESAHLRLIEEYPKPQGAKGQDALLFYEVIP